MVKRFGLIIITLVLLTTSFSFTAKKLVFDYANLLTQEQIDDLQLRAEELTDIYKMEIAVLTIDNANGKSSRDYADSFFEAQNLGIGDDYSGVLFLIDMDNREAYITTSGQGIRYLTDERIENILNSAYEGLSIGDYYKASVNFLETSLYYFQQGIPSGQYSVDEKEKKLTPIEMILSFLASLGVGGGVYGSAKSKYKTPIVNNPFSFRRNSITNIAKSQDRLIDTRVVRRNIPKAPPPSSGGFGSSGRSTTHKTSSGRTFGGGGKKF